MSLPQCSCQLRDMLHGEIARARLAPPPADRAASPRSPRAPCAAEAGQVLVDRLLAKGRAQGGIVRPVPGICLLLGQQGLDGVAGGSRSSLLQSAQEIDHHAVQSLCGGPAQGTAHHPAFQRLQCLVPLGGGQRRLVPAQHPQQERTDSGGVQRLDNAVINVPSTAVAGSVSICS